MNSNRVLNQELMVKLLELLLAALEVSAGTSPTQCVSKPL
jgi:hypothetical protein